MSAFVAGKCRLKVKSAGETCQDGSWMVSIWHQNGILMAYFGHAHKKNGTSFHGSRTSGWVSILCPGRWSKLRRINSSIRPPYVNEWSRILEWWSWSFKYTTMFYHPKTLNYSHYEKCQNVCQACSHRQCFSEESNLLHVSPRRTMSSPLWQRNWSCYRLPVFERLWSPSHNRKDVPTMQHWDAFQCQSNSKR